jgi:16S rRNA (cytidine1402-2'-O)-methyltransferase
VAALRGRLLVVGTPIGNLGDLSPRAADALRTADLVVAEDTRVAARLLAHVGARRPTRSFNEHNAAARLPELLARLAAGETLALTTDAGMPGISDPGPALVAAARAAGAAVEVVPGPTAVTAAMALSGEEAGGFVFGGFLPARPASARVAALERLLAAAGESALPLVLYEAPPRLRGLLALLDERVPDARLVVARELTKRFEEVVAGWPSEIGEAMQEARGELTVVISGLVAPERASGALDARAVAQAAAGEGLSHRSVANLLRAGGLSRRQAYDLAGAADQEPHDGELRRVELALARRDPSLSDVPLAELLHPDFAELGASGRAWDRDSVIEMLATDEPRRVEIKDFRIAPVGPGAMLATYRAREPDLDRETLRSSLWLAHEGRWRLRFHHGTQVSGA